MITQLRHFVPAYLTHLRGKFPHRYVCIDLTAKANQLLLNKLIEDGFFDFFITNNAKLISEHQLVAFYLRGGKSMMKQGVVAPMGLWECHHINGCTTWNDPKNIVLLPCIFHDVITKLQKGVHRYMKLFRKSLMEELNGLIFYDWRGRLVKDNEAWCTKLIMISCIGTYHHCLRQHICDKNVRLAPVKQIQEWIKKVVKKLKLGIDPTYVQNTWLVYPNYFYDNAGKLISAPATM